MLLMVPPISGHPGPSMHGATDGSLRTTLAADLQLLKEGFKKVGRVSVNKFLCETTLTRCQIKSNSVVLRVHSVHGVQLSIIYN